jgi:hypothetical protein
MNWLINTKFSKTIIPTGLFILLIPIFEVIGLGSSAYAATYMTKASVIETNMQTSGPSQVIVAFAAGANDIAGTLTVNFNGWTGGGAGVVAGTQTISTATCAALVGGGAIALPGTLTAAGATSIVTVSSMTALTTGSLYCFTLTSASAVTNPSAVGQSKVTINTTTDSTNVEIYNLSTDIYSVSATVVPTFTFGLSGTTDSLGSLSSASTILSPGVTATISTNANNGWGIWAIDTGGASGLTSISTSKTIAAVTNGSLHTFTTGSAQYGIGVTVNPVAAYTYGGGTTGAGISNSIYTEIATNNAPAAGLTTVIHELADISATQQAAQDYTDSITLVGAGSF